MKRKALILIFTLNAFALLAQEYDVEGTRKIREYYIMDGTNSGYVWAEQITPQKVGFGSNINGEYLNGGFEFKSDTLVWSLPFKGQTPSPLALLRTSEKNDTILIYKHTEKTSSSIPASAIGKIYPPTMEIWNRNGTMIGQVINYEVIAPDGRVYLTFDKANPMLVAYYFLNYYYNDPNRKHTGKVERNIRKLE